MKFPAFAAAIALSTAAVAHAGPFGFHPATMDSARPSIDASTLMYGHPASPLNRAGHANFEHPAVTQRGSTGIDAAAAVYGHPASPLNGSAPAGLNVAVSAR